MERSGNFYKAIRLGYILISILIGCMVNGYLRFCFEGGFGRLRSRFLRFGKILIV